MFGIIRYSCQEKYCTTIFVFGTLKIFFKNMTLLNIFFPNKPCSESLVTVSEVVKVTTVVGHGVAMVVLDGGNGRSTTVVSDWASGDGDR